MGNEKIIVYVMNDLFDNPGLYFFGYVSSFDKVVEVIKKDLKESDCDLSDDERYDLLQSGHLFKEELECQYGFKVVKDLEGEENDK